MIEARRAGCEAELRLMDPLGRGRINGEGETEFFLVGKWAEQVAFGCAGDKDRRPWIARKKYEQRDRFLLLAEESPVRGTWMLKAAVDDVLRVMRFCGLWDEAAAAGEGVCDGRRKIGKRTDGKVVDGKREFLAVDRVVSGGDRKSVV